MSVRIMSWVWDHGPQDATEALVMLALADYCDDEGRCYPSMRRIAEKARMQERSAQRVIRRLEAAGWISVATGNGRHGCNLYQINTKKHDRQSGFSDAETPTHSHSDPQSPRPTVQKTPTLDTPEPSRTVIGGGGRACAREADFTDRELILGAMGVDPSGMIGPSKFTGTQADVAELRRWQALPGLTMPIITEEIRRIVAAKPDGAPTAWKYFTPAMARLSAALTEPPLQPDARASPRPSSQPDLAAAFARLAARSNPQ